MRNETDKCKRHTYTMIVSKKGVMSSVLAMAIVLFLFSSTSLAYVDIGPGTVPPTVTGPFSVSQETTGSYVEPTNSFDDGSPDSPNVRPKYFLITRFDTNKILEDITYNDQSHPLTVEGLVNGVASGLNITYNGQSYPLTSVCVTSDISKATYTDPSGVVKSIFSDNSTVFFDYGTYNDSDTGNMYYRFSRTNLSMIGLYSNSNGEPEPSTKITKSVRSDGMTERNVIAAKNIYIDNLIFDGLGKNLVSGNRGENAFGISGGGSSDHSDSSGFVMKNCIIQNYGDPNSSVSSNRNTAFLFYQTSGQHNFENLIIRNMNTQTGYGVINFNQATGNYFKNVSIDGSLASSDVTAIKVESADPYVFAGSQVENTFTGNLTVSGSELFCRMYIQDYGYNLIFPQITGSSDFRYIQYSTTNGYNIKRTIWIFTYYDAKVAAYAIPALPAADVNTAVLDLKDNYWIVRSGDATSTVENQLTYIKSVLKGVADAGGAVPSANIKIVANSDRSVDSFTVPDFGNIDVNIVAVASAADSLAADSNSRTNLVPLYAGATITYTGTDANASLIRLFNFNFSEKANYTLQEAIEAKIPFATPNTFVNCRFTSLDVTYYGNGNTSGSLTTCILSYLDGNAVTIQSKETLEKDGYTFIGWNTTAAGDGVTHQPGVTLSITDNMELFAKWELVPITPTDTPTAEPTVTTAPTSVPTAEPTVTTAPTSVPTTEPTVTTAPTSVPTTEPTVTTAPTSVPTTEPTVTTAPTSVPTTEPTVTTAPTSVPTTEPTVTTAPTSVPTTEPTVTTAPTSVPTTEPTVTSSPTSSPTPSSDVLGADKSITPTPTATPTPTVTPTSTPAPTPATGVLGTGRADENLPKTGEASSPNIAFGVLSILLSGGLLVLIKKRKKHYR